VVAVGLGLALQTAALVVGCVSAVPRVDAGLVQSAREAQLDADTDRLQAGYEAFRMRCTGCHQLTAPAEREVEVWPVVVADHRERLVLTDDEAELIVLYLQAARIARAPSPTSVGDR